MNIIISLSSVQASFCRCTRLQHAYGSGVFWPGSSVHGILQARIMEWFPFPSPRNLPDPGTEPESPVLQANLYHPSHQGSPATQNALPSGQQCGHTRKQPCSSQNIQVRVAGRWTVTVTVVSCKKMLYSSPCRRS